MTEYNIPEKVRIVWFSGTGGTRMAAEKLAANFAERGVSVCPQELSWRETLDADDNEDLLIVIYPVYAMSAPAPIYDYVKNLGRVLSLPAAVISVSGGGEVTPNKACRRRVIKLLEKRGYRVVYEQMLLMPANVLISTPLGTAVSLLRVLPEKTAKIAGDLLSGATRRTKPGLVNTMFSAAGVFERIGARWFGRHIKVNSDCNGCGSCAENCPSGNIRLEAGRPVYGKKCYFCMRCLYICPKKALSPRYGQFFMIREGFNLREIEKAAADINTTCSDEKVKGVLWGGVQSYLTEKD
jgi:ferredoxin/flavodoxin